MFTRATIDRCVSKGLPIFTITHDRTVVHIERNAKLVGQYQQRTVVAEGRITNPLRHVRRWVCERLWSL
jgi:energy-converting hydrogenase Eha subunit F